MGVPAGSSEDEGCILLPEWAIRAGPRKTIYQDPSQVRWHGKRGAITSSRNGQVACHVVLR